MSAAKDAVVYPITYRMETIQRGFMAYGVQTSMNCYTELFSRADFYVLSVKKNISPEK